VGVTVTHIVSALIYRTGCFVRQRRAHPQESQRLWRGFTGLNWSRVWGNVTDTSNPYPKPYSAYLSNPAAAALLSASCCCSSPSATNTNR
jgi:hypothetical protein